MPLFQELRATSNPSRNHRIRAELIVEHLPVAEHIAHRFRDRGQPEDDLRQVAALGLVKAVDRFDPSLGTDFLSFAVPTITGELRRHFRDSGWTMRIPRPLQELVLRIRRGSAELAAELGRAPRPTELAAHLGLAVDAVRDGLAASAAYRPVSLDQPVGQDGDGTAVPLADRIGVEDDQLPIVDDREALYPALQRLPERERTILVLRFYGNLTQTQIAQRVNLSQMHVSRLLTKSLQQLREFLSDNPSHSAAERSVGPPSAS